MIALQNVLDGVTSFAVNDVIAAMPNGVNKFLALMAVGSMRNNPAQFVKPYESMLKSLGILSSDGSLVDELSLRSALNEAFEQMPKFNWLGFTFTIEDAKKLLQRIGA